MLFLAAAVAIVLVYVARERFVRSWSERAAERHRTALQKEMDANIEKERRRKEEALKVLAPKLKQSFHAKEIVINPKELGGAGDLKIETTAYSPGFSEAPPRATSSIRMYPAAESAKGTDDSIRINEAIQSVTAPAEILLSKGVYRTRTPIKLKSGIVLKGEGMRKTVILSASRNHCIIMRGASENNETRIVAGYTPGSRALTVEDASELKGTPLARIYFSDSEEDISTWQRFYGHVIGIEKAASDNEIHLKRPLRLKFLTDSTPRLSGIRPIEFAGLEDLTIETERETAGGNCINMDRASNCWVKNCELSHSKFSHISVRRSVNLEFTGNYIHHGWAYEKRNGEYGYGLCLEGATADCLVADNVFESLRHAMIVKLGANGNVFAYNFSTRHNPQRTHHDSADFCAHGGYAYMNLLEGNVLQFAHSSDWGGAAGPLQTFYRNKVLARGIIISYESHYPVIVGNVIRGSVYIEEYTLDPVILGNVIGNAYPQRRFFFWDVCRAYNDDTRRDVKLLPSLYASQKPSFLTNTPWPCFGPDVKEGATLPAQRRYEEIYSRWDPLYNPPGN